MASSRPGTHLNSRSSGIGSGLIVPEIGNNGSLRGRSKMAGSGPGQNASHPTSALAGPSITNNNNNNSSGNGISNGINGSRHSERRRNVIRGASDDETHEQDQKDQRPVHRFMESSEEILEQFKNEQPSVQLHIHTSHYRFGSQDGVIPHNHPMIKEFFEYVLLEQIPPEAVEVFRDSGVRFYNGCIILEIIDHRPPSVTAASESQKSGRFSNFRSNDQSMKNQSKREEPPLTTAAAAARLDEKSNNNNNQPGTDSPDGSRGVTQNSGNGPQSKNNIDNNSTPETSTGNGSSPQDKGDNSNDASAYRREYRTILRPTPLSLWHDMLYTSDPVGGRFPDPLALAMESEILSLTIRNVDLHVRAHIPPIQEPIGTSCKHLAPVKECKKRRRPLHEDLPHTGTELEENMLIMNDKPASTFGQFHRLSFVEQWRRKRERLRQAALLHQQQSLQQKQQQQRQSPASLAQQQQQRLVAQQRQMQQMQQQAANRAAAGGGGGSNMNYLKTGIGAGAASFVAGHKGTPPPPGTPSSRASSPGTVGKTTTKAAKRKSTPATKKRQT